MASLPEAARSEQWMRSPGRRWKRDQEAPPQEAIELCLLHAGAQALAGPLIRDAVDCNLGSTKERGLSTVF
jgi:hypothetical protein